ncbi:Protein phosphatase 2C family protein [Quillaja saponaria]|uniref:protein-serine/threonine phosphatase n=1 Tax=Quillaja saponaria TaxID=32244 RepID=A0AAD7LTG5_QUISA|nr:Protein phosphatase 2C family protein [Quillaja saponaria]
MPCAVGVPNSPIFSPSRTSSVFYKPPSSCSSPRISHRELHASTSSFSGTPISSSPLGIGFLKQINGLINCEEKNTVLKRKRPGRIDIPVSSVSFNFDTPKDEEKEDVVEVEGEGYSVYCKRGRRGPIQDRYSAVVDLHGDSRQAFFGVFDGHGGANAAEFAARNMDRNIINHLRRRCGRDIVEAVRDGYLATDAEILKEDVGGGTCCVTALIQNHNLVVSNAGDCRAVLSREGNAEALTSDHRPSRIDEKERIETSGGYVDRCHGAWRIQGTLAVSRGLGDRHLKQWIIAEPESTTLRINPTCEFLILASDGLWDKISNQEAVDIVRPLCRGLDKPRLSSACKKLVNLSVSRGSTDDISVMLIQLGYFSA